MQDVFDKIQVVSGSEDTVFIYGETGTGKELVARAIHALSARGEEPFVAINMGALPADILESELFGYRKGAFTGATRDKVGKFEYAGKGTLFLDEICSLSTALQSKLLRVLEEKAVTPLGDNRPVAVGARIIAATNRRLEDELRAGTFRKDLFYRLNMLPIEVPPLRERRSDIPLLVENFREEYCRERKEDVRPFDRKIVSQMVRWEWSGNVRELRNYVRMLCVYQKGTGQPVLSDEPDQSGPEEVLHDRCLKEVVEQTEKEHIIQVLNMAQGQVNRAHKILGISRKCLYDKMNKHGLKADSFRELPH